MRIGKPFLAALLSAFVFPGAGQFYNRQYLKGGMIAAVFLAAMVATAGFAFSEMSRLLPATAPEAGFSEDLPEAAGSGYSEEIDRLEEKLEMFKWLELGAAGLYLFCIADAFVVRSRRERKGQ